MTVPVTVKITVRNRQRVQGKVQRYPRKVKKAVRNSLFTWGRKDLRPMLNRVMKGFRAANVPASNAPTWANYKARAYGIGHSLGDVPHSEHPAGHLRESALAVEPRLMVRGDLMEFVMDYSQVPKAGYPYLHVLHEGLDGLHQAYPMVEAARMMTHRKLLKRLDSNVSKAWKAT